MVRKKKEAEHIMRRSTREMRRQAGGRGDVSMEVG